MKKYFILLMVLGGLINSAFAQKKKIGTETITLRVEGNCDMCKKRVENAVSVNGVKTSNWDEKTKVLSVIVKSDKLNKESLAKLVAAAGYDNELFKADSAAYEKLPDCCHYRSKSCDH